MNINQKIKDKLKTLPASPGVYIMKDVKNTIIYVGKAKILKNRVRQYFHDSTKKSAKVLAMVSNIDDFEYIITDSEFEALCLECNLIKSNSPKYNILLKDDKHYPFIRVSINEDYPEISLVRKIFHDGAKYFGPYPSSAVVYDTIGMLNDVFKIKRCKKKFPRDIGRERPCLYYFMHKCSAVCVGKVSSVEYKNIFKDVCKFLDGSHEELVRGMRQKMVNASVATEYEKAADYRDKIESIERIAERQKVISSARGDMDIFAVSLDDDVVVFEIFYVRSGKLIGSDTYKQNSIINTGNAAVLEDFITAFYNREIFIPDTVVSHDRLLDQQSVSKWLSEKKGKNVTVKTPVRGELKKLTDMAFINSNQSFSEYKIELLKKNNNDRALCELAKSLGMENSPTRIEAYDISNTGGNENVGAMVVFENGKKKPADYKRFKIKYIVGSNDYECMKEVLVRRFLRYHSEENTAFSKIPSLILVDGGKGHVSAAREVLAALNISVPVYGMFKDTHHKTAGLIGAEGEVGLAVGSAAFRLVTYIQDEAHRFAVTYHRNLRSKVAFSGEFDKINGVGDKRRKILMTQFKSIECVKNASFEELCSTKGIDKKTAKNIYEYFRDASV